MPSPRRKDNQSKLFRLGGVFATEPTKQLDTRLKSLLTHSLLVVFGITMALLIAEGAFRVAGYLYDIDFRLYLKELKNSDRLPRAMFIKSKGLTRLKPNAQVLATTSDFSIIYDINSLGIRDKFYSYGRVEGRVRILGLGDSFTFGEGVPYGARYTDIAEEGMDELEIINAGVPGYGVDHALLLLMDEGIKYQPDYVFLFINHADISKDRALKHDIDDQGVFKDKTDSAGMKLGSPSGANTVYLKKSDSLFQSNGSSKYNHSYLVSYLKYHYFINKLKFRMERKDKKSWNLFWASKRDDGQEPIDFNRKHVSSHLETTMDKYTQLSKKHQFTFVVINIDAMYKFPELEKYILSLSEINRYVDLSDSLTAFSKKNPLRFRYDPHYNAKTHKHIALELSKIIFTVLKR